jgi:thioredoxin reductase (NADPH)
VIGSANYAAEEALQLTAYTRDITIISNGKEFEISAELIKELAKAGIRMSKEKIFQFNGKAKLESLVLADKTELKPDGVFLAIGAATALAFSLSLAIGTDKDGFIRIDKDTGRTDIDGVYAAGGCTGGNQQIAKSVGEGCNAAIDLIKKLKGLSYYADQT